MSYERVYRSDPLDYVRLWFCRVPDNADLGLGTMVVKTKTANAVGDPVSDWFCACHGFRRACRFDNRNRSIPSLSVLRSIAA